MASVASSSPPPPLAMELDGEPSRPSATERDALAPPPPDEAAEDVAEIHVRAPGLGDVTVPAFLSDEPGVVVDFVGDAFGGVERALSKLIRRGKRLALEGASLREQGVRDGDTIMLISSRREDVERARAMRPDPLLRSMEDEEALHRARLEGQSARAASFWGEEQDPVHKFCRFTVVPRFTHPHPFEAEKLLIKLATDPGIKRIMKQHAFTVGSLNEMDPRDDRLAQKKEAEGACLLGYNENAGAAIYLRLRTDDETDFRGYDGIVNTLMHELAHNLRGPHDAEFWAIYARFKKEYLEFHAAERGHTVRAAEDESARRGRPSRAAMIQRSVQTEIRAQAGNRALSDAERRGAAAVASGRGGDVAVAGLPVQPKRLVPRLGASQSAARREARERAALAAERRAREAVAVPESPPPPSSDPPARREKRSATATTTPATTTTTETEMDLAKRAADRVPSETRATLRRVLANVAEHPDQDKFRRLRTSNERVAELLGAGDSGARELLGLCGFRARADEPGVLALAHEELDAERLSLIRRVVTML